MYVASWDDGPAGLAAADEEDATERQAGAGGDPPGLLPSGLRLRGLLHEL